MVSPLSGSEGPMFPPGDASPDDTPISSPGDSSPDDNLIPAPGPDSLPPRAPVSLSASDLGQTTAALARLLQRLTVGSAPAQAALPLDAVVVGVLRLLQATAMADLEA